MFEIRKLVNFYMPSVRVAKGKGKSRIEVKKFPTLVGSGHILKELTVRTSCEVKHSWLCHFQLEEIVKYGGRERKFQMMK